LGVIPQCWGLPVGWEGQRFGGLGAAPQGGGGEKLVAEPNPHPEGVRRKKETPWVYSVLRTNLNEHGRLLAH